MQTKYVQILRKIKQKGDGESKIAKELAMQGVQKLLEQFAEDPGILEASRKLYNTAIKTYKVPNALIAEIAKEGASLLFEQFGKSACPELFHIFSNAIIQYLDLNEESLAQSLTDEAIAFFTTCESPEQAANIAEVLKDPHSKSNIKLF
jgi:hypothetical protein